MTTTAAKLPDWVREINLWLAWSIAVSLTYTHPDVRLTVQMWGWRANPPEEEV